MSPTQASSNTNDFPRLTGPNFEIWKTRVTTLLDGKGLLGFVTKPNYDGSSDYSDDEESAPPASDGEDATIHEKDDNADAASSSSESEQASASDDELDPQKETNLKRLLPPAVPNVAAPAPANYASARNRRKRTSSKRLMIRM